MKVGDPVAVNIAGDVVAQAKIESVDEVARTVTMVIPATRVVMGLKVELDTAPPVAEEPSKQVIITGVDRVDSEGNIIEGGSTSAPGESATVVENAENATSTETPTGGATQEAITPVEPAQETVVAPVESSTNTDA